MSNTQYGLFCPLAMACEVLEPRWTILILGEMWGGATRFNEIRRGVPGISPTLLSKRLREMEEHGLVDRIEDAAKGTVDYIRTAKAEELEPALRLMAEWAYKHVEPDIALKEVDPDYLIWNIRQKLNVHELPRRKIVIRFHYVDAPKRNATNWIVVRPGEVVELCMRDPKFDVDLYVEAETQALASAWMGYSKLQTEIADGRIFLSGDPVLAKTIDRWMGSTTYAGGTN